jgi:hypothetical protein
VCHVGIYDRLCEYTVYTYTVRGRGVWFHRRGGGLRHIKHLPQSPFTGKFFLDKDIWHLFLSVYSFYGGENVDIRDYTFELQQAGKLGGVVSCVCMSPLFPHHMFQCVMTTSPSILQSGVRTWKTHARATFWRTFHYDGKMSPVW